MSVECLDTDTIVSVAAAFEWNAERLDHVAACPRCRSGLEELMRLRTALTDVPPVAWAPIPPGTASLTRVAGESRTGHETTESLPGEAPASAGASPRRRADTLVSAATFLIAGVTTLLAVSLLVGAQPGAAAVAAALVVGAASIVRARPPRRGAGAV